MNTEDFIVRVNHEYMDDHGSSKSKHACFIDRNQSLMMKIGFVRNQVLKLGGHEMPLVECGRVVGKLLSELRGYREENGAAYLPMGFPLEINETLPSNQIVVGGEGLITITDLDGILHHNGECCDDCKKDNRVGSNCLMGSRSPAERDITFIRTNDGYGMYVDGQLVFEDKYLDVVRVLRELDITAKRYNANMDWFKRKKKLPKKLSTVVHEEEKTYYYQDSKQFKEAVQEIKAAQKGDVSNVFFDSVFEYMKTHLRISERQYSGVMKWVDAMHDGGGDMSDGADWSDLDSYPEYHDPYFDDVGCR